MSGAVSWIAPLFPDEEVPHILHGLQRCLTGLRKEHDKEHENPITKRLFKALRQDAQLRDRPVHADLEVYEDGGDTGIEGRLDIRFLYFGHGRNPLPCLAIEAKRLHVAFPSGWKSLVSEYVTGHQGMMCFITGRYSGQAQCGVMMGFVFDGQTAKARAAVSASIASNAVTLNSRLPGKLDSAPAFAGVWQSLHSRGTHALTIYHLFQSV